MRYFYVVVRKLESGYLERTSGNVQAADSVAELILSHRDGNCVVDFYSEITKDEYDEIKKSVK